MKTCLLGWVWYLLQGTIINGKGMRILLLFWVLGLAGCCDQCSSESAEASQEPMVAPAMITDSSVMVFWESERFEWDTFYNPPKREDIEQWWTETQQCTEMEAEPPTVYIVDDVVDYCPTREGTNAVHCVIDGESTIYIQVNGSRIRRNWKHEFQHYLAWANDKMEYYYHEPEWWWQCEWN